MSLFLIESLSLESLEIAPSRISGTVSLCVSHSVPASSVVLEVQTTESVTSLQIKRVPDISRSKVFLTQIVQSFPSGIKPGQYKIPFTLPLPGRVPHPVEIQLPKLQAKVQVRPFIIARLESGGRTVLKHERDLVVRPERPLESPPQEASAKVALKKAGDSASVKCCCLGSRKGVEDYLSTDISIKSNQFVYSPGQAIKLQVHVGSEAIKAAKLRLVRIVAIEEASGTRILDLTEIYWVSIRLDKSEGEGRRSECNLLIPQSSDFAQTWGDLIRVEYAVELIVGGSINDADNGSVRLGIFIEKV